MPLMSVSPLLERCQFLPPGSAVDLAVSGGADSLALLVLGVQAGCVVTAYHVDHGLRPGSSSEAETVEKAAERYGAAYRAVTVELAAGPNLEARARQARFAALPQGVATGHTADDQAETVLVNLLRGAATDGLAGMRPGPRHPILALRRSETRQLCEEQGLEPVEDESNTDRTFLRNRVRHEILPLLSEAAGRDLVPVLIRQASIMADESDLLDELAAGIDPADTKAVAGAHPVLARRAVRRWLRQLDPEGHPPSAGTVERVMAVAAGQARACEVAGAGRIHRSKGRLVLDHSEGRFEVPRGSDPEGR
jgi:tRNA(Ile)-lysidine synthase